MSGRTQAAASAEANHRNVLALENAGLREFVRFHHIVHIFIRVSFFRFLFIFRLTR